MFPGHVLVPSGQNITHSEYNHGFSFADASFAAELRQIIQDQKDLADNLLNQDAVAQAALEQIKHAMNCSKPLWT